MTIRARHDRFGGRAQAQREEGREELAATATALAAVLTPLQLLPERAEALRRRARARITEGEWRGRGRR